MKMIIFVHLVFRLCLECICMIRYETVLNVSLYDWTFVGSNQR